jgi:hypothetical protein
MNTYAKCTKFPSVRGGVTAVLIAAFLATLSAATPLRAADQALTTQPSTPGVIWAVLDGQQNRTVYYLGTDGTAVLAANLGPVALSCTAPCKKVVWACLC